MHADTQACLPLRPAGGGLPAPTVPPPRPRPAWRRFGELAEVRWAVASVVLFAAAAGVHVRSGPAAVAWTLWALCFATGGWEPAVAGIRALGARTLDVDLLMVVAAVVAAAIGQVVDGGLLIVIFSTSGALEAVATRQTRDSVRSLLQLAPEQANVLVGGGSADGPTERRVAAGDLAVGDVVVVRPGELVSADGEVVRGASEVDQSSVTGESAPVPKAVGDTVYSGTLNTTGVLQVRVDRPASESVVARIVALVEEAGATKAETQLWIERIEQRYSLGVVVATIAFVTVPLVATDWSFRETLLRAMTFMIVASPCAVVLATMPPLLSAVANAGRHGVLVKSTVVMERVARVDTVVLDKTGTVTEGRPQVSAVTVDPSGAAGAAEVLGLAAAVEQHSEHALGAAIATAAGRTGVPPPACDDFAALPGRGVSGRVAGRRVEVVNPCTAADRVTSTRWWEGPVAVAQAGGATAVVVTADGVAVGVIALHDTVRADARDAIASLGAVLGHPPVLLTGDNRPAADQVAARVGIVDVHADLLPEGKVARIRQLQASGRSLMVVGDGVNDAPALAAADLGIAMGQAGSDLTLQAADGVILRDRLGTLPCLVGLSRRARRMVLHNLGFAVAVILVLVGLDLAGHLPLPLGVAGHEGSTVVIGLNGLRLLRGRAWTGPPR